MKRILLSLLSILLIFCLVSCDLDGFLNPNGKENDDKESSSESESSGDESDDEEDESSDESSSDESSSEEEEKTEPAPDKTVYSNKIDKNGKWIYGTNAFNAPTFSGYYHGYSSALTMTFDDGYDSGTGRYVSSIYAKYGFRGTAMLGPCFLNDSLIKDWNEIFAEGYLDAGCHGYDHINPPELASSGYEHEIKDAIYYLREKFPTQRVLTFATPFAHINDPYEEYLKDYAISNRLEAEGGTVKIGGDYNLYRVKSISVLSTSDVDMFNQSIANAVKQAGSWTVELYHCVTDNASGRDATKQFFSSHCQYLYNHYKDTVWVASFEDVSIYLKQIEAAKINYVASDRESMSISITHDLDKDIYNIPMTVKLQVPTNVTSAYAVIDGVQQPVTVSKGSGVNAITVKDVPVNSDEPVKIYFGGNDLYDNGCYHRYGRIETVKAGCETHGYAVYECIFCYVTYKTNYTVPKGHSFTVFKEVVEPGCETEGYTLYGCENCDKTSKTDLAKPKGHDFSQNREIIKEATKTEDGLVLAKCSGCNIEKEITTTYANIAPKAELTATDGINAWTYLGEMFDGKDTTGWTNGTNPVELLLEFNTSSVDYVEVIFERYCDQSLVVSIYDGTEWTDIGTWSSLTDANGTSKHTVSFDVEKSIKSVKITFNDTSRGCTKVCEIGIYGITDK